MTPDAEDLGLMSRAITIASLIAILLFSVLMLCLRLRADTSQQRQLREIEEHWLASEDNPDALQDILADDFIHVLPGGFVTKTEQISYLRAHPRSDHTTYRRFEDLRIRVFGRIGIVNGLVVATGGDGKPSKTLFTDVFAYRNRRWQAVNAQENAARPEP